MVGQYAVDEYRVGPRPAVLLCHEGPGLDEHVKGHAVRLASLGYAAFALDYHGGQVPIEDAMARASASSRRMRRGAAPSVAPGSTCCSPRSTSTPPGSRRPATASAASWRWSSRTARTSTLSSGSTPGSRPPPRGAGCRQRLGPDVLRRGRPGHRVRPALGLQVRDARRRVADWRIELYGGVGHSFTNPRVDTLGMPGFTYDEVANRRSWRSMLDLLEQRLGPVD